MASNLVLKVQMIYRTIIRQRQPIPTITSIAMAVKQQKFSQINNFNSHNNSPAVTITI